jgi:NTE family protein
VTVQTLREHLREAPFTLTLSAGFFGFFAHAGFMATLEDEQLLPARLTGASAGGLVAGLWAGGVDAPAMRDVLARLRREHFWDPAPGLGLLRGRLFRAMLRDLLPAKQFFEARRPVALSVWDVARRETFVKASGDLVASIHATCALPALFQPVVLDGRLALDGGISDRPAHAALGAGERVLYHHLAGKSPWRGEAPAIPARERSVAVELAGLPRLGPFRLGEGMRAFDEAARRAREALSRPVGSVVRA